MRWSTPLRESRLARSAFFSSTHESQPPRIALLARTAAEVRIGRVALLPRYTSRAAESGATCRWRGASAKAQCSQESKLERLPRHHRHEQINASISAALHRSSV